MAYVEVEYGSGGGGNISVIIDSGKIGTSYSLNKTTTFEVSAKTLEITMIVNPSSHLKYYKTDILINSENVLTINDLEKHTINLPAGTNSVSIVQGYNTGLSSGSFSVDVNFIC